MIQFRGKQYLCPLELMVKMVSGKWKGCLLCKLFGGDKRYAELQKHLDGISQKMLTQQLKELEKDGLVTKTIVYRQPIEVTYSLTEKGRSLRPVIEMSFQWCKAQLPEGRCSPPV